MLKIVPMTKNEGGDWDDFVTKTPLSSLFHLYDWSKICEEAFDQENLSFSIKDNEILALIPLSLRKHRGFRYLMSSGFGGYGGVLMSKSLKNRDVIKINDIIHDHVDNLCKEKKIDFFQWVQSPFIAENLISDGLGLQSMHARNFNDKKRFLYMIDLSKDENELWKDMESRSRGAIRKAEKNGIKITGPYSEGDGIERFYEIRSDSIKRSKAKNIPFEYYRLIWERLGRKGFARLLFAEYRNKKIGVVLLGVFKNKVFYWSGGSVGSSLNLGQNNLLQWHAINWAKRKGYKWYEVGEAHLLSGSKKQTGLDRFKNSFGGKAYIFYEWTKVYNFFKYKSYLTVKDFLFKLFPNR